MKTIKIKLTELNNLLNELETTENGVKAVFRIWSDGYFNIYTESGNSAMWRQTEREEQEFASTYEIFNGHEDWCESSYSDLIENRGTEEESEMYDRYDELTDEEKAELDERLAEYIREEETENFYEFKQEFDWDDVIAQINNDLEATGEDYIYEVI